MEHPYQQPYQPMAEQIEYIPLDRVDAGPYQPRVRFDAGRLEELAESIRCQGFLQPVVVRRVRERFQLIAGERRVRAARLLRLEQVPAIVRQYEDDQALEVAIVENLQREEITVVEQARAFERLAAEFGYSHGEIAQRTGKSRAAITNSIRLLHLPAPVLDLLDTGQLTEGHARALLALPYSSLQVELAEWVVRNAVPVRETERKVRSLVADPASRAEASGRTPAAPSRNANVQHVEDRLRHHFGTQVALTYRGGRGSLTLEFYSDEDLERLLELLGLRGEP